MTDCKTQILNSIPNTLCCSHSFVNAIFLSSSQIDKSNNTILINLKQDVKDKFMSIIQNLYPDVEIDSWEDFLLLRGNIIQMLSDCDFNPNISVADFDHESASSHKNPCDKLTTLKTLFLVGGRFYYNQDNFANSKGYSLEFVFRQNSVAEFTSNLLSSFGFLLKTIKRQSSFVVYTKNSETICDLFTLLGASGFSMEIQNNLAMREMRNMANRQNNCFEFNLDKTINASTLQLEAINYIINNCSLDFLDENLREVALARLANPDISLNDLRLVLNNKLSRAGIKYRLDKIIEIYHTLKGEN